MTLPPWYHENWHNRSRILICPGRISIVSDSSLPLWRPVSGDCHNHTLIVLNRAYHVELSSLLVVSLMTCIASQIYGITDVLVKYRMQREGENGKKRRRKEVVLVPLPDYIHCWTLRQTSSFSFKSSSHTVRELTNLSIWFKPKHDAVQALLENTRLLCVNLACFASKAGTTKSRFSWYNGGSVIDASKPAMNHNSGSESIPRWHYYATYSHAYRYRSKTMCWGPWETRRYPTH